MGKTGASISGLASRKDQHWENLEIGIKKKGERSYKMRIKDIIISDVLEGKNWSVLNPDDMLKKEFAMEDLEIELLTVWKGEEEVVYSGIYVYLEQPLIRCGFFKGIFSNMRRKKAKMHHPPDFHKDLKTDETVRIKPLLMVKHIPSQCWDYMELVDGKWRQLGLKQNINAPHSNEYFANPIDGDPWFDVCDDNGPIRELHKQAFREWIPFLKE
jgi:hypothetical protein